MCNKIVCNKNYAQYICGPMAMKWSVKFQTPFAELAGHFFTAGPIISVYSVYTPARKPFDFVGPSIRHHPHHQHDWLTF